MSAIMQLCDVSLRFGSKHVLSNVNLSINQGTLLGLVGRSGAGKTTLLRVLTGMIAPSSGKVFLPNRASLKKMVGFASQEYSFYPQLSVVENLWYFGRMYGLSSRVISSRIKELLVLMQLEEARHRIASKLSGGMKRRLDIALALIHDPPILVLDEPTTGLDVFLQEMVWSLIHRIHALGKTVIISSHDLRELEKWCTELVIVSNGKLIGGQELKSLKGARQLEVVFREVCDARV
ncbi:ABC transporter ATP-binding protein [Candidatus Woesearchaeota archaeon]|nr:ABC transporter ATP-binding protein [Candidatus Woesearchaeota archaeon]